MVLALPTGLVISYGTSGATIIPCHGTTDGHAQDLVNVISPNKLLFYPDCPNVDYVVSTNIGLTTIIDTRYIKPTYEETYFTEPG